MPNNEKLITVKDLQRELRSAKGEVVEYREMVGRARSECKDFEKTNLHLNQMRLAMYDSLIREKAELEAALMLVDVRLKVIGLHPSQRKEVSSQS